MRFFPLSPFWEDCDLPPKNMFRTLPRILLPCRSPKRLTVPSPSAGVVVVSLRNWAVVQCAQLWTSADVPLPGVDQLLSEPAGQRLTHPVEQLGQLNVVIPVVLPEERLGLKRKWKGKKKWAGRRQTTVGAMWRVKGSYLRVHFRVPATFTFP